MAGSDWISEDGWISGYVINVKDESINHSMCFWMCGCNSEAWNSEGPLPTVYSNLTITGTITEEPATPKNGTRLG